MNVFGIVLINFLLAILLTYVIGDNIITQYNQSVLVKLSILSLIMSVILSIINNMFVIL